MADRYLRSNGNWNDPVWAATSGGAAGSAATPTSADRVYISANYTCTIGSIVDAECETFSHTNGTLVVLGSLDVANGFSSTGSTSRTIELQSGSSISVNTSGGANAAVFWLAGSNLTFDSTGSLITVDYVDPISEFGDFFATLNKTFTDVVINLGKGSGSSLLNITGSPTFRSLIIQSKNSAAHTVNFDVGATINVTKFVAVGSSNASRLTLKNSLNSSPDTQMRFAEGGSSYGQYVNAYVEPGPYPDYGGVPLYIGSNSSQDTVWLLQDPPKISTLVDPLTTAPGSNPNWTVTDAWLVSQLTAGYYGGGYRIDMGNTLTSIDTYDFVDSPLVIEHIGSGIGPTTNISLRIGEIASITFGEPDSGLGSKLYLGVNGIYTVALSPTTPGIMISLEYVSATDKFVLKTSSDGTSWTTRATSSVVGIGGLKERLRSERIFIDGDSAESGGTIDIGSINPNLKPKNQGAFLQFF